MVPKDKDGLAALAALREAEGGVSAAIQAIARMMDKLDLMDVLARERRGAETVAKWYREAKATLDDIQSALPDEAYEAKDWVHGTTVSRVLWLRGMYENVRGELGRVEAHVAELERTAPPEDRP